MIGKRGFTLIEVLIVIIILGILATIAVPQFANMILRARIAEAWTGLGAARAAVETFKLETGTDAGMTIANLGIADTKNFTFTFVPTPTVAGAWILRATGNTALVPNTVIAEVNQDNQRRSSVNGVAGLPTVWAD